MSDDTVRQDGVPVLIRHAHDGDVDMITSDWLNSFRDGYFNATVPNRVYYDQHHKILEDLLGRATTLVACNGENPSSAFGWVCFEAVGGVLVLHYIYVKRRFRESGLARRLVEYVLNDEALGLAQDVICTTHQTQKSKEFIKGEKAWEFHEGKRAPYEKRHPERPIDWLYNPYALFWALTPGWENA